MIEFLDLEVSFASRGRSAPARPLRGFSMRAPDGACTGIIGANGAGKTTLFRAALGLVPVSSGKALVSGIDPAQEPERARKLVGMACDHHGIPPDWHGRDSLLAHAALIGLRGAALRSALSREIERWGLGDFVDRPAAGLSRGQGLRIALAREALAPAPNLILDEPTAGLDFNTAALARAWAREMAASGRCVLISTHIVADIKAICHPIHGLLEGTCRDGAEASSWVERADADALATFPLNT
jgi:sodium transport system ATP-binding protein